MSLPNKENLLSEIALFVRNPKLVLLPEEIEPGMNIPQSWEALLRQQKDTGVVNVAALWSEMENELPSVLDFLRNNVQGVGVLIEEDNRSSLLYIYTEEGELYLYRGGIPLGGIVPPKIVRVWTRLPPMLCRFYSSIHDGWTFLPSNALGPLPIRDMFFLSESEWDFEKGDEEKLPFKLSDVLAVFGNGSGDYLCLDTSHTDIQGIAKALIWWHEEPLEPKMDVDFWPVLDHWSRTGYEGADPATS